MAITATLSLEAEEMPIKALQRSTRDLLAQNLDPATEALSTAGLKQDWTGLAELMGISPLEVDNFEEQRNPTQAKTQGILREYSFRQASTVKSLWALLLQLQRHDILENNVLLKRIEADFKSYKQRRKEAMLSLGVQPPTDHPDPRGAQPPTDHPDPRASHSTSRASHSTSRASHSTSRASHSTSRASRSTGFVSKDSDHQDNIRTRDDNCDPYENLTVDDVNRKSGEEHIIYDAFVSYCSKDFDFVKHLMELTEEKMGLRLCINARDLIPGSDVHYVTAHIISQRCRKFIAIMSPDYLQSPECDFQVKIALALSPGASQRILIPIKYRECVLPPALIHINALDYTRMELADWFCRRLGASLHKSASDVTVFHQITRDENTKLQSIEIERLPDLPDLSNTASSKSPQAPKFKGQGGNKIAEENDDRLVDDEEETSVMKTDPVLQRDMWSHGAENTSNQDDAERLQAYYAAYHRYYESCNPSNHPPNTHPDDSLAGENCSNHTAPPTYSGAFNCEPPPSYQSDFERDIPLESECDCDTTQGQHKGHDREKDNVKTKKNVVTRLRNFCKVKLRSGSKKSLKDTNDTPEMSITTVEHAQIPNMYSLRSEDVMISPDSAPNTSSRASGNEQSKRDNCNDTGPHNEQFGTLPHNEQFDTLPPNEQFGTLPHNEQFDTLPHNEQFDTLPHNEQFDSAIESNNYVECHVEDLYTLAYSDIKLI